MSGIRVGCLDVWDPEVRRVVGEVGAPRFACRFATSYDEAEQADIVRESEFLLVGWAAVSADLLRASNRLRMIHKWGIGVDRIDVEAVRAAGIPLAITAGANAAPVAELAIALTLAVYRRLLVADKAMREGRWLKAELRTSCFQIAGKTVGLLGFGNIGRMLARRLRGFEPRILYFDERRAEPALERDLGVEYRPLAEVVAEADILSLHLPLTEETRQIVDAAMIARMKRGAVLINTARGELVDESALYDALVSGHLLGAGLDAFADEPPPAGHPLFRLDNVVATPHCGGGVMDNVVNVARHAFGNMERFLDGQPINPADVVVAPR